MIGLCALALFAALAFGGGAGAATVSTVSLGNASNFAVLAGSGITDVPTSTIHGDVGVSPITGAAITGLTCAEVTGAIYSPDGAGPACAIAAPGLLTTAKNNFTSAYGDAAGRTPGTTFIGADNQLGGKTLSAGVYRFPSAATFNLIGNLTLSGDSSSVWIFQATSDFKTAGSSTVTLTGGAQACHVFWQVGSSATLGGSSNLKGTVLSAASITVGTGASISGRLLAQALVTLDSNSISRPGCSSGGSSSGSTPNREIYCDPSGKSYNLEVGQDKLPPYDKLGLVPAYVDPVTGAKSCTFPASTTVSTATTTTATTATTATTPTPPPPAPVVKAKPKPPKTTGSVASAQKTLQAKAAAAAKAAKAARAARAAHTPPQPAQQHVGLTG